MNRNFLKDMKNIERTQQVCHSIKCIILFHTRTQQIVLSNNVLSSFRFHSFGLLGKKVIPNCASSELWWGPGKWWVMEAPRGGHRGIIQPCIAFPINFPTWKYIFGKKCRPTPSCKLIFSVWSSNQDLGNALLHVVFQLVCVIITVIMCAIPICSKYTSLRSSFVWLYETKHSLTNGRLLHFFKTHTKK